MTVIESNVTATKKQLATVELANKTLPPAARHQPVEFPAWTWRDVPSGLTQKVTRKLGALSQARNVRQELKCGTILTNANQGDIQQHMLTGCSVCLSDAYKQEEQEKKAFKTRVRVLEQSVSNLQRKNKVQQATINTQSNIITGLRTTLKRERVAGEANCKIIKRYQEKECKRLRAQ